MTLSTGTKLSHYEIASQLGKGGMGEVYQATDTKLGRSVAIKVLPEEFAKDADRIARFQREAKLLASLNHPNIAAIHGLEESDGTHFLVMELIEGQTMDARIKSGSISVEESLKLALQIAEALEAAHEKGVIHRDLKPANIKVTPDGKVKVLDFGLAKAFAGEQAEVDLSQSPTLSQAATQQGIILGTAAYMSPEQARGKPVDKRADVWAFGVVLFEMLSGKPLFSGEDVSSTLARVLEREPDFSALPANLHSKIIDMLERCLEKEARNRYCGISDARVDIVKVLTDPVGLLVQSKDIASHRRRLGAMLPWMMTAFILGAVIIGSAVWKMRSPEPKEVVIFNHTLPEGQRVNMSLSDRTLAVSPDGNKFVYVTNEGLFLRSMDALDGKHINGTNGSSIAPFFSPDGRWIGYLSLAEQKLKRVAIDGTVTQTLCDGVKTDGGFSWSSDNRILHGTGNRIMWIPADSGGDWEPLVEQEHIRLCGRPVMLPDGESLLFQDDSSSPVKIMLYSNKSGKTEELLVGTSPHYLRTGHIVYGHDNNLYAVPFDIDILKKTGNPARVIEGIFSSGNVMQYSISSSGTLVYLPGEGNAGFAFVEVDREGNGQPIPAAPLNQYLDLRLSPDGKRVATAYYDNGNEDIRVWNLDYGTMDLITNHEGIDYTPIWTPDGREIIFTSSRKEKGRGIYRKDANGTSKAEEIVFEPNRELQAWSLSSDGKDLLLMGFNAFAGSQNDIGMVLMNGDKKIKWLLDSKFNETFPMISPNRKWMAYVSNESGQNKVYVRPYPDVKKDKKTISTGNGESPLWSHDGKELFYITGDTVMVVPVIESETEFKYEKPQQLFRGTFYSYNVLGTNDFLWDIFPDGERFLMVKPVSGDSQNMKITVIRNWLEELKEKVPVP